MKKPGSGNSRLDCAEEEIRTPTPGYGRYHLKVVRLPISPPPRRAANLIKAFVFNE